MQLSMQSFILDFNPSVLVDGNFADVLTHVTEPRDMARFTTDISTATTAIRDLASLSLPSDTTPFSLIVSRFHAANIHHNVPGALVLLPSVLSIAVHVRRSVVDLIPLDIGLMDNQEKASAFATAFFQGFSTRAGALRDAKAAVQQLKRGHNSGNAHHAFQQAGDTKAQEADGVSLPGIFGNAMSYAALEPWVTASDAWLSSAEREASAQITGLRLA